MMRIQLKKSLAELWLNPGRSVLVVLALCIGLWGIGSNMVSFFILQNDLNENFIRAKPFHVVLKSKDFAKLDLDTLKQRPEIEDAEFRELSYQRIEVLPDQWIPLWLMAVDNFNDMRIAQIYSEEGNRVPDTGTMLIERNGQLVSNLRLGSKANVRAGSENFRVPISGIVFDPAQAPATQDAFIYAYVDKATYQQITHEKINQRLLLRLNNVHSKSEVQQVTQRLIEDFQFNGIRIDSVSVPKYNTHPHQFQLNTLVAFQGSIGFLALIMGVVLVSQLMESILSQQVKQIGILKAIGSTRRQVIGLYLMNVLLLGIVATLVTVPVAVVSGYNFAEFVATVINFNILTTTLPHYVYVLLIATGILLPVLMSLPTLLKGTRISVREALSDYGINSQQVSDKQVSTKITSLPSALRLAWRNIFRRKKRMLITVSMISLGVAIFSAGFNVRQSLIDYLNDTKQSLKYDVQIVLKQQVSPAVALAPFKHLENVHRVETWSGGSGRLQSSVVSADNGIGVVAFPYDSDLITWNVIEGRWLQPSSKLEIVINQYGADLLDSPKVGQDMPITINGIQHTAKLVGVVSEFNPPKIYMDKIHYNALFNQDGKINSLMFLAEDRSYQAVVKLKKDIEHILHNTDLDVLYVMSQTERAEIIYNHLDIILTLFALLSLLVLAVSALGMASATGINVLERTREIGVMRAIGATPGIIKHIFVSEGIMINSISILLGLLLSLPLSAAAAKFFGNLILGHDVSLAFAFSSTGLIFTLLLTLVFGWLASRIPARKAVMVPTREALSYE